MYFVVCVRLKFDFVLCSSLILSTSLPLSFYLVFTFYRVSRSCPHVRFRRRARRAVLVRPLEYARRPKCGSSYVRHPLLGRVVHGRRAYRIAHGETTWLGYNVRTYRRQWHRRDARQEGGRIKCLTADTMLRYTHTHTHIHTRAIVNAIVSAPGTARAHIVTSAAKRLTTSANFARTPRIGS